VVLQFDLRSVRAIGVLAGVLFIAAGVNEFIVMGAVRGWRWLHGILGGLFILTGIAAIAWPGRTFVIVANIISWVLLFKGTADIVTAFATKGDDLWWVLLVAGVVEIVFAVWAASYPGNSVVFLVLWVGISALMRGITELVLAFQLRRVHAQLT
jgi:uncharacterized membrane protein HdeD (DUF308 family)